ncbi:MAG: type II secretion system protein N [Amphiplicatus sp.]
MKQRTETRPLLSARLLGALCGASALVYALAFAPASFIPALAIPPGADVSVTRATGTIWRGVLENVRTQGVAVGDIAYKTNPLALFAGRFAVDLSIKNGALAGRGRFSAGLDGKVTLAKAAFRFELNAATRYAFLGAPLDGELRADVDRLTLSREGCIVSRTRLWTDALAAPAKRFATEGFDLAGDGVCSGRDLLVALSGEGGVGAVNLSMRVSPDLSYTLIAEAEPARSEVADILRFLGFAQTGDALTIGATGALQGVGS